MNYTCVVLLTEVMRLERHYLHSLAPGYDKDAVLQDLMKTYGDDVWNFAYFMTRKSEVADDISQEVFLTAYHRLYAFRGDCSVKSWLLTITRNKSLNYLKSAFIRRVTLVDIILNRNDSTPSEPSIDQRKRRGVSGMEPLRKQAWTETLREPPFSKSHFTEELKSSVMQRKNRNRRRFPIMAVSVTAAVVVMLMIGLTVLNSGRLFPHTAPAATQPAKEWEPTGLFMVNGIQMLGHEGKFGIRKMNRTEDRAFLISKAGYHVEIYFWGDKDVFNGKYKLTATKKDTNKTIPLYEWPITVGPSYDVGADAQSGAKFGIDEPGLWRLDVSVNDVPFDSVIVDVKEPDATRKSS